ncbi:hypothetical protein [Thiomicrorhabdus sp. Milos-T2]|uniref:hypothetical protein n=1 Tax=Thiomicrorhabdus sp. Milos-T2 TaxID=90814 RepID=UPI0004944278|nr:hypothetical protein [Thiomicrorhabdus sp. Milos-T2]
MTTINTAQNNTFMASSIANNGIKEGFNKLGTISQELNRTLPNYQLDNDKQTALSASNKVDYEALNKASSNSLETNMIGIHTTENHIKSLVKVLEVENNLFDDSMGKIFDSWA